MGSTNSSLIDPVMALRGVGGLDCVCWQNKCGTNSGTGCLVSASDCNTGGHGSTCGFPRICGCHANEKKLVNGKTEYHCHPLIINLGYAPSCPGSRPNV